MGFSDTIWQEFTKRNDVMNVKRLVMLTLWQSAALTGVIVALAGLFAYCRPFWAVIFFINFTALPVSVILAQNAFAPPSILACIRAKARPQAPYVLHLPIVGLTALLTGQDRRSSAPSWGGFTDERLTPSPIAGLIAKSMGALGRLKAGSLDWLAAVGARRNNAPLTAISGAKAGTVFTAWDDMKRLAATFANLGNEGWHGISSNKKTLAGLTSDCCRSNQDDQQGRKHNDTCAQQGAQIGCYLIASTGVV